MSIALIIAFLCLVAQVVLCALPGIPVWAKCVVVVAAAYATLPLLALMPHNLFTFRGPTSNDDASVTENKPSPGAFDPSRTQSVYATPDASPV